MHTFIPFPILSTTRLLLRQLTPEDNPALFTLRSDERVNQYLARAAPASEADTLDFIRKIEKGINEGQSMYWVIADRETDAFMGTICLFSFSENGETAEIGYELHPDFWRKGFAAEAIAAVLHYAFQTLQLEAVTAGTESNNIPSASLLQKAGFVRIEVTGNEDGYEEFKKSAH